MVGEVCPPGYDDDDEDFVVLIVKFYPPVVLVEVSVVDGTFSPEIGPMQHIWESYQI